MRSLLLHGRIARLLTADRRTAPTMLSYISVLLAAVIFLTISFGRLRFVPAPEWLCGLPAQPSFATLPSYKLPDYIIHNLGPYAPRYTVKGFGNHTQIPTRLPPSCKVVQVNILHRHGARFPTVDLQQQIISGITKVRIAALKNPLVTSGTPLAFMSNYSYTVGVESLVDFGRKQMYASGQQATVKYLHLSKSIFIRTTSKDRVLESARWFKHGFTGGRYSVPIVSLPYPDVVIPRGLDVNSTLASDSCLGDQRLPPIPKPSDTWLSTFANPIAARLNSYIPTLALAPLDIYALMSNCGLETAFLAPLKTSPWCNLFTETEWEAWEYAVDLEKYWSFSYGSLTGRANGSGWVNELVSRLTGQPVHASGSVNRTLDSDPATFPIPPAAPDFFADFTSDNMIDNILTALGIVRDDDPLPYTGPPPTNRLFVTSKMIPFAAQLVVEKVVCPVSLASQGQTTVTLPPDTYVRLVLNDAVIPLLFTECNESGMGRTLGMCSLDEFVKAQAFSAAGGDWDAVCRPMA